MTTSQLGRQLGERDLRSVICKDGPCVLRSKELMLKKSMYVQSHKQCNFEAQLRRAFNKAKHNGHVWPDSA